jgi:trimeric autotransporter adhesin
MASTYSDYKFELIGTGEQAGTWGNTTNTNIGTAIEQAIGGKADITMATTSEALTLTDTNALQDARAFYLNLTGTPGGAATLEVPAIEKPYVVKNATTGGYAVTVKVAGQTGVSVPNGQTKFLYNNGTDVTDVVPTFTGQGLTQTSNTSLGKDSLSLTASGADNTGIGNEALQAVTSGYSNTAVGKQAGADLTTGNRNTAVGWAAMAFATTGIYNVGIGAFALVDLSTGEYNTVVGGAAGGATSGSYNTAIGNQARTGTTGSNNTALGQRAGNSGSPFTIGTNSNRVVVGDSSVTNAYIQVAWTVVSDARDKVDVSRINHGLNLITKLSPITFRWDSRSKYFQYDEEGNITAKPEPDGSKKNPLLYSGFLAQEVQQAIEEVGYPENIIVDTEDPENLKLKETALIPVLVNAVKELKAELDTLKAEIAALKGG